MTRSLIGLSVQKKHILYKKKTENKAKTVNTVQMHNNIYFQHILQSLVHEFEISVASEYLFIINDWFEYKQAHLKLLNDRIEGEKRQKWWISQRMLKHQKLVYLKNN